MTDTILTARHLHKQYGQVKALDDVSLNIRQGEIFGLLGPNGAGKTTAISMMTGLFPPDDGTITVAGLDVQQQARAARQRIGLVPQELALYPALSAWDNLIFFGRLYGLHGRFLHRRAGELLALVGLEERARDPIQTYSGGMKRRANIAAGLLHEPDVLFLDEPTVGVDPQSRNAIFEGVEALNAGGMTVVYTTHYMEEAQRLCHRVGIMDEGRIIAMDTPHALVDTLGGGLIRLALANGHLPAVQREIGRLPAVKESAIRRADGHGRLEIQARRAQEALLGVLEVVQRHDARVTALEILEPNLETVFLHLTGKQLRD